MNTFQYKLLKDFGALKKGDVVAKRWKMGSNCVYTDFYCKIVNKSYDYKHELNQSLVEDNTEFFTPYAFTTEDKVDMYVGDTYWYVHTYGGVDVGTASIKYPTEFKSFSTKKAAENYLLLEEAKKRYPIGTKVNLIGLNTVGDAAANDIFAYNIKSKEVQKIPKEVDFEIWGKIFKKVIATTNPSIDIPKVVDEVAELAEEITTHEHFCDSSLDYASHYKGVKIGYNKSQETHPFSEDDMIEFLKFYKSYILMLKAEKWENLEVTEERLLEVWKNQRTTVLYYG